MDERFIIKEKIPFLFFLDGEIVLDFGLAVFFRMGYNKTK